MATVTLEEPDRPGSVLPDICLKCGRPALERTVVRFRSIPRMLVLPFGICLLLTPKVAGLALGLCIPIVVLITIRNRITMMGTTFHAPLCNIHKDSLFRRFWIIPVAALICLLVFVFGARFADMGYYKSDASGHQVLVPAEPFGRFAELLANSSAIGLLFLAGISVILPFFHRPRAVKITDFTITLTRVAPAFVQAYAESRRPAVMLEGVGDRWRDRAEHAANFPPSAASPDQFQKRPE
jgi:hypothetical protein